jgi:succinyl-diaminopimelate desuccinylase
MTDKENTRGKIDDWFYGRAASMIADIDRLVRIQSVRGDALPGKPYGEGPAAALEAASEILRSKAFQVKNFENRVITVDLNEHEPALGILAHLDIVPAGEGWDSNPFELVVRDGVLCGRGTADDKGPAVAAIYAMCAARELAPELEKGCRLMLGSAEETGHDDMECYMKAHRMPPNVFSPDSDYPVVNLEKGRYVPSFGVEWTEEKAMPRVVSIKGGDTANVVPRHAEAVVEGMALEDIDALCGSFSRKTGAVLMAEPWGEAVRITSEGRASHAMAPSKGINAQTALLSLLAVLPLAESRSFSAIRSLNRLFPHGDTSGTALGVAMDDELSGELTLNFGVLAMTATGISGNFDSRLPVSVTEENMVAVADAMLRDAGFLVFNRQRTHCHHTPAESRFVQTLLRVYQEHTGLEGACLSFGGQTYVHNIDGGVAFGCSMPGVDNRLHDANEFIEIENLILSAKMFTQVILDMCS